MYLEGAGTSLKSSKEIQESVLTSRVFISIKRSKVL
jgi:hypothetical protein